MSNSNSSDMYKMRGYGDEEENYISYWSPMEVPLIQHTSTNEEVIVTATDRTRNSHLRFTYPGNRRVPMLSSASSDLMTTTTTTTTTTTNILPPAGTILVRTAGNALQAIPAVTIVEEKQSSQLIEVQVPPNTQPGDTIHVRSPYNMNHEEEEVLIAATIPTGVYPGQIFYVQCPLTTSTNNNEKKNITTSTKDSVEMSSVAVHATKEEEQERRQQQTQCGGWWW